MLRMFSFLQRRLCFRVREFVPLSVVVSNFKNTELMFVNFFIRRTFSEKLPSTIRPIYNFLSSSPANRRTNTHHLKHYFLGRSLNMSIIIAEFFFQNFANTSNVISSTVFNLTFSFQRRAKEQQTRPTHPYPHPQAR